MFTKITYRKTGQTYWYDKSDFLGGCWHIFVSPNHNAHVYNIFSEKEFNERFEPFNEKKCKKYVDAFKQGKQEFNTFPI